MKNLYLIAILPPEQLSGQLNDLRQECAERFNVKAALKPPVHITLYPPFFHEKQFEAHLVKQLLSVPDHDPFEQELENFNSFHNHTLYIRAIKNPHISVLQRSISSIFSRNKIDRKTVKSNTSFTPHITVAYRDIPPEIFPMMWEEYKDRKFKRSFTVDRFTLLKHDGKKWNILREFPFKQIEVLTLF